jgi:hypothetical protein
MYPYAFVQVSEIADRFDINVVCNDMYGIPENQWENYLQKLLRTASFDMILITLRNTDIPLSLNLIHQQIIIRSKPQNS